MKITAVVFCLIVVLSMGYPVLGLAADSSVKWEYHCVELKGPADRNKFTETANKLGTDGWEMVSSAGVGGPYDSAQLWCFKRQSTSNKTSKEGEKK